MLCCHLTTAALAVLIGASVWAGLLFPPLPPRSTDPDVAALKDAFAAQIAATAGLTISGVGELKRDRDTAGWSLLADHFGSNPNTPYMFTVLPFLGFALPSPIMHVRQRDAVVLLARRPPSAEYFSFTTFAAWTPRRGVVFGSLADSVNHLSLNASASGLFAHIVTSNRRTYSLVERALVASGLPAAAINLVVIPAHLHAEWTQFETVLRLFRFANQTEGSLYLRSHHPLLYLSASHADEAALPPRGYSERRRPGSADERGLASAFEAHGLAALAVVGAAFGRLQRGEAAEATAFAPLMIRGPTAW
uniref:Uncharacterized protein n=1 Tax=Emiliania huxleyi TaxID=2903 RepID=A0A7S3TTK8_EMIHU